MLQQALTMTEDALAAGDAGAAAMRFAAALDRHGASYIQARLYRRPTGALDSAKHWRAGGVLVRRAVPGWVGSGDFDYICFDQNPLLDAIRRSLTRYRFSDFAPHRATGYRNYWDALGRASIADAVCGTAYGADGTIASVHVGLPTLDIDPQFVAAAGLAGTILCHRLMDFAMAPQTPAPTAPTVLTPRERDVIAFVAEGKTDWEIATIIGIAETTARFHVDNARRKLNATNRSHAVARFIAQYGAP